MENLYPEEFFTLTSYEHAHLFKLDEPVWKALLVLESFFKTAALGKIEGKVHAGAHLINPELISIGAGSVVEPGAYIQGPCIIGKECEIRHGAYVRGFVVTGDHCVIGHATEVKHSILLNHACAAHFNYVGDSILGNHVNLGAGVKLANLRFDHQEICVHFKGKKIQTGLKKFGSIIGDRGQLGCNAVTNPGTLLGPAVFCAPCLTVHGVVAPQTVIRR